MTIFDMEKPLTTMNELLPMTLSISSCLFSRFGSNRIQVLYEYNKIQVRLTFVWKMSK